MFIIKTKTKVMISILGIVIIVIGIIVSILIFGEKSEKENPSFDEICKFYNDNKESFNIANNYLLKQLPNEKGFVHYDINTVEKDKSNMTEEEYEAMKSIFSNPMIDDYYRYKEYDTHYNSFGKFTINSNNRDGPVSICYITYGEVSGACTHIADNWYKYIDLPPDGPLKN